MRSWKRCQSFLNVSRPPGFSWLVLPTALIEPGRGVGDELLVLLGPEPLPAPQPLVHGLDRLLILRSHAGPGLLGGGTTHLPRVPLPEPRLEDLSPSEVFGVRGSV